MASGGVSLLSSFTAKHSHSQSQNIILKKKCESDIHIDLKTFEWCAFGDRFTLAQQGTAGSYILLYWSPCCWAGTHVLPQQAETESGEPSLVAENSPGSIACWSLDLALASNTPLQFHHIGLKFIEFACLRQETKPSWDMSNWHILLFHRSSYPEM